MGSVETGAPDYEGGGLSRETNWWGAFVIGLAGTILVTGIAPVMVTSLGAAAIPLMVLITITGYLLCLLLAELSAMMPERTGGSPSYAYVAYKQKWPRFAKHVNGFTAWAYWLGWFPVAPLNMILASFYIADKFNLNTTSGITPIHTFIAYWTIVIAVAGILLVFIPAWLGIRIGALFATVLGLLSMIPLSLLAILPLVKPSSRDFGNLSGFHQLDGSSFFSNSLGHGWLTIYIAFAFLLTWNVIAMEAAACYIGECRDPERDAKIAMNLEGLYGLFIYTMIPVSFVIVFGASKLSNPAFVDPKTMFSNFASAVFGTGANWLDWLISIMLVIALSLSVLNAIMGSARAVYQMAIDGQFPRIFASVNKHGVPGFSMGFNVACSIALVFTGGAVEIYTLSNVGYTASFIPVLVGYYLLRRYRPDMRRPVRLPEPFKYIALFLAALYFVIWLYGGLVEASLPNALLNNNDTKVYFFIGWAILLSYVFFYWYRVKIEDPRHAGEPEPPPLPAGD
ncbi:MAG TPA: APC family permease [Gaiellales bacterium]|jgi:amino acid transporter|nr:APC family permease [Gaiellales bacterium]